MSKIITTIVLTLFLTTTVFAQKAGSTYINPLDTLDNKQEYLEWIAIEARNYNVSESLMLCLINHENTSWNPSLQSYANYRGNREESYGLAQIHLPAHPEITKEQAQNPKFAISWMASEISEGRAWQWSTLKYCK